MRQKYAIRTIELKTGIRFEVSGYDNNGKQHRVRFKTEEMASGYIHKLEQADKRIVNNANTITTTLTPEQVKEAEQAFAKLPDGKTLADAVDKLVKDYNAGERPLPLADAIIEHVGDMEARGCSIVTSKGTRSKLRRFVKETGLGQVPIDQITKDDAQNWLKSLKAGSQSAYRLALSGLWSFSVERKWCKRNILELPKGQKKKRAVKRTTKVAALSVEQCSAMLKAAHADGKTLAWTAVAIFAGLRPESELQHLSWDNVDLRAGNIYVEQSKVDSAERHVKIHSTLKAWLQLATGQEFAMTRADLKTVKRAAGYKSGLTRKKGSEDWKADQDKETWIADITRHTFGSNLYGRELSYNKTADQMGNSVAIVKRHYRKALPSEQVERFWQLTPEEVLGEKALKAVS